MELNLIHDLNGKFAVKDTFDFSYCVTLHTGGGTERDRPTVGRKRSPDHRCCAPGASFHAVPEGHAGNRHPPWRNTRTQGIPPKDPP